MVGDGRQAHIFSDKRNKVSRDIIYNMVIIYCITQPKFAKRIELEHSYETPQKAGGAGEMKNGLTRCWESFHNAYICELIMHALHYHFMCQLHYMETEKKILQPVKENMPTKGPLCQMQTYNL